MNWAWPYVEAKLFQNYIKSWFKALWRMSKTILESQPCNIQDYSSRDHLQCIVIHCYVAWISITATTMYALSNQFDQKTNLFLHPFSPSVDRACDTPLLSLLRSSRAEEKILRNLLGHVLRKGNVCVFCYILPFRSISCSIDGTWYHLMRPIISCWLHIKGKKYVLRKGLTISSHPPMEPDILSCGRYLPLASITNKQQATKLCSRP